MQINTICGPIKSKNGNLIRSDQVQSLVIIQGDSVIVPLILREDVDKCVYYGN